ncbi:MAG: phosphoribosylaminoimidazolesuccinocarboxamide synthase [Bacteroidota bacterium]
MTTIKETNFDFKNQTGFYRGKVRDVYYFGNKMVIIATDRISAFDIILPRVIPFKGQILNQIASHFLHATADIAPNWLLCVPDQNVSFGIKCEPFAVEMVVRGYLAGHSWREYKAGRRELCGVSLPDGLNENDKLPTPIITPSTKAHEGHDEDITKEAIIERGIVSAEHYKILEEYTLKLFERGTSMAADRDLILVDTKYEFGLFNNKIHLIDEIHTPDSSRYFYKNGYEERQANKQPQKQLSKEFVREWLIENNFQGLDGQTVPEMTDEIVNKISERYIELFEVITGKAFVKPPNEDAVVRIEENINKLIKVRSIYS